MKGAIYVILFVSGAALSDGGQAHGMHTKETMTGLYRTMYTIGVFETRCIRLYRQGTILPVRLSR